MSDLVFLAELPTFINATADISDDDDEEKDRELCERLCNNLVNYNKFRIIGNSHTYKYIWIDKDV